MSERKPMSGAELIAAERRRQVEVEGWTPEHDAEHGARGLADAAWCYEMARNSDAVMPDTWPWEGSWWKPKGRLRNLVRAGALYLAASDVADPNDDGWYGAPSLQATTDRVAAEIDALIAEVRAVPAGGGEQ